MTSSMKSSGRYPQKNIYQSDNLTNDPYALTAMTQNSFGRGLGQCTRLEKHQMKNQRALRMRVSSHQKAYIDDLNSDLKKNQDFQNNLVKNSASFMTKKFQLQGLARGGSSSQKMKFSQTKSQSQANFWPQKSQY